MLKAFRYQLYPTFEQKQAFNYGIYATSIYYNFILGFYVTAFKMYDANSTTSINYLSIKRSADKSPFIDVINEMAYKCDKKGELIKHNEWLRQLVTDYEYHPKLFIKKNGTAKSCWSDIAEACATYAKLYYKAQFKAGLVDQLHPFAAFERGAMQMARDAVKNAVKKFWETRTKAEPMKGFPRFKSRKNPNNSYTYSPNFKIKYDFDNRTISYKSRQYNIGDIKIGKGRIPPKQFIPDSENKIIPPNHCIHKSVTISKSPTNKYYLSLLIDDGISVPEPKLPCNVIGIDIGLKDKYCALSDERIIVAPKALKNALNKLRHAQRNASRKIRRNSNGKPLPNSEQSSNYFKAMDIVNNIHEKITNIRNTFQHKITADITNSEIDTIAVETLAVKSMMINDDTKISNGQKHAINRAYSDAAIFGFISKLEYKCKWKGKHLVKVGKYFASSQICSSCGYKNAELKNLNIRSWICPKCNESHDRDINAAINIRLEGMRLLKT